MSRALRQAPSRERGFTLVEMLVAVTIFAVLGTVMFSMVASMRQSGQTTQQTNDLNEQARLTLNRIARELRQAKQIESVLVNSSGTITGITFDVDFNGNGVIDVSATDPERLTYCYVPPTNAAQDNGMIMLTANVPVSTCANPGALPVLADEVTGFTINLQSSNWQDDGACGATLINGVTQPDGITEWQELDCAANGGVFPTGAPDATALNGIDSVTLVLKVLHGAQTQVYQTQVDLRNRA